MLQENLCMLRVNIDMLLRKVEAIDQKVKLIKRVFNEIFDSLKNSWNKLNPKLDGCIMEAGGSWPTTRNILNPHALSAEQKKLQSTKNKVDLKKQLT